MVNLLRRNLASNNKSGRQPLPRLDKVFPSASLATMSLPPATFTSTLQKCETLKELLLSGTSEAGDTQKDRDGKRQCQEEAAVRQGRRR